QMKRKFLSCCSCTPLSLLYSIFPILHWLPRYRVREHLVNDVVAGFTVSIMHIPQGLAYGVLAGAGAINGLYVSAFPAIVYFFMGTSKHVSVGTFAVVSLLSASALISVTGPKEDGATLNSTEQARMAEGSDDIVPTSMEVLAALAIVVGVIQVAIVLIRKAWLTLVLATAIAFSSRCFVGFFFVLSVIACAWLLTRVGAFPVCYFKIVRDVVQNLGKTNLVTLAISVTAMVACFAVHEGINARYKAKLKMPVPIDLIVIIAATAISYFCDFNHVYGVKVMGYVPTGLPVPEVPRVDLMVRLILDGFVIAIVSFTIALSMAKLFAKRHRYQIDPNQELNALGAANVITSFFGCYPCAVSLSRSSVQEKAGGQTQLAAVISSAIVIVIILAAGPLFRTLPSCILSAVIIVALKGMLFQVRDCVNTWKVSRLDALTWMITFTSVVVLDIDIGIGAGIGFSVVTVILRTLVPYVSFLGNVPDTDIYLDVKRYKKAKIPRVKIFHFSSALYFANRDVFKNTLMESIIGKSE
ncbi:sulfate/bicarbonate/oxalate exchanger SAT-1, putative, partial [Ixodes scapularis]